MKIPAVIHQFSKRPFPETIANFDYDPNNKVLQATKNVPKIM